MLFLDRVYVEGLDGVDRFLWVKAPSSQELTQLAHTIAYRIGRFLERDGLLERDAENSSLASDAVDDGSLNPPLVSSITYCIAIVPQAGRKMCTLQILPEYDEPFDVRVGNVVRLSLHAGVVWLTSQKANGSNLNAALTPPRQGFAVPDGWNGADGGGKVGVFTAT